MNDRLDKLKDIEIENKIWIIYIEIIIISWYTNNKEKTFLLYNDKKNKKEYQNLLILIFSILVIIYYYFAKDSYDKLININEFDSNKKKYLLYLSFIASFLILISEIIFLNIAIQDDQIDVELAFN